MKVLHTADWHLGAYVGPQCDDIYGKLVHTCICLDTLVNTAREEQPDLILIAGDIFHAAKVWADRALAEVRVAAMYINRLAQFAPVAVLYGTPSHDGEGQFETLREMTPGVTYFTEPGIKDILTNSGIIQVAGLPGFDKGHFRANFPGLSAEEENRVMTDALVSILSGLSAQVDPQKPAILMAHHTVVGCDLDNGQSSLFLQNELVLPLAALNNSAFDLVCLGHIHRAQLVHPAEKHIFYAGSIDAYNFNDEGHKKGFWIHEFANCPSAHRFIETPAREFQTFLWSPEYTANYAAGQLKNVHEEMVRGKVVRILYACDTETEKALNKKKLEQDLYAAGAYYVSEIRPEKIHEVVNREKLHEKLTVRDCLIKYLQEKGHSPEQISKYLDEATPFIEQVEACQPAGGQTGLFLPVALSVRNYRSYAEETLSFLDIYFAMVNGANGAGKSSLFMDAIVDCLYEQPREGELTGWIRAGEKSGSISFTFRLGNGLWRVSRTRQRSGKATLALAKGELYFADGYDGDEMTHEQGIQWEDHSCERMADTQQKIIDLLGMDADTFRSCVLIMQDQYGRFLEAKPEDRMNVLASLLGLGVYEQLEEQAKETLREVARKLKTLQEDATVLEAEVAVLESTRESEKHVKWQIDEKQAHAQQLKTSLEICQTKLAAMENAEIEFFQVDLDLKKKTDIRNEKQKKLADLQRDIQVTEAFLEKEPELKNAHIDYLGLQYDLITLEEQVKLAEDKRRQLAGVQNEIASLEAEYRKLRADISGLQANIESLPGLLDELDELTGVEHQLEAIEKKRVRHEELIRLKQEQIYAVRTAEDHLVHLKKQAEMLQNAQCVDIERAQCAFLREAKEAAGKIAEAEHARDEAKNRLNDIEHEILALNYNPDIHAKLTQQVRRYNELKQGIQACEAARQMIDLKAERVAAIERSISEKSAIKEKLENELSGLEANLRRADAIRKSLSELAEQEKRYAHLPAAKQYLETARNQFQDLQKDVADIEAEILTLQQKKEKLQDFLKDVDVVRSEKRRLEFEVNGLEGELSELMKKLGSIEEKLKELDGKQNMLQEVVQAISETAKRETRLQILAVAFGRDGIPHQIIRDIIPELEASANEILGQMTGGRMRLEFRTERQLKTNKSKEVATLDIVIIDVDNGELPYLARSGGQKVRAALAVSFALAILKASRVGLQLGMMFVDEPPFLDAEGVEAYCMALESIHSRYPEMRIIAISHDQNMKSKFPQQLYVELTESGSKLKKL